MNNCSIIKTFCRTKDPKYLEQLSDKIKKFMVFAARSTYYSLAPGVRTDIANIILKKLDHYEIPDWKYKEENKYNKNNYEDYTDIVQAFIGLMFILRTHRNSCSLIWSNLETVTIPNLDIRWKCDDYNKRILYHNFPIYENFKYCQDNISVRFIIISVMLLHKYGCDIFIPGVPATTHANFLIYDKKTKIMERFEPHGSIVYGSEWYDSDRLDKALIKMFVDDPKYDVKKYISPIDVCPNFSFQHIQVAEGLGYPGSCLMWSYWYTDMRLTYPDIQPYQLQEIMLKKLQEQPYSMTQFIKNYAQFLHDKTIEIRKEAPDDEDTLDLKKLKAYLIKKLNEEINKTIIEGLE